MQRMASWILTEGGYAVTNADSVTDSIKREPRLEPDVILIDARDRLLRDETRDLRSAFSGARIAALHFHAISQAEHVDAECHLHTPFHADELLECVEHALAAAIGATSVHTHG
jgi:hypothetical protein